MGELSRNNDALRLSYCSFILFSFLCVFLRERKREKELRVFLVLKGIVHYVMGRRNRKEKGGKGRGKGGVDERKGVSDGCLALPCVLLWLVVTHHTTCFLLLFLHNHTHLPLLVLCLVLSFSLSLSFSCLCVCW